MSKDSKTNKPTFQEFYESALILQKQLSESLFKISEHMREMEQDPKMRGGRRYAAACRNFPTLSKRFTDNMKLINQVQATEQSESESNDFLERIEKVLESEKEKKGEELDKKMLLTIKEARTLKKQLLVKKISKK